jgi:hypothetical protein
MDDARERCHGRNGLLQPLGERACADVVAVHLPFVHSSTHGPSKDGRGLWWKVISRNKRTATLVLSRPRGPGDHGRAGRRRRRADRELPPRRDGEVGPRAGAPPRDQPRIRHAGRHRVRPDRSIRAAARVRDAGGGDERAGAPDRSGRWPADAAAVRARRRCRGDQRCIRGHARALPPRRDRRRGSSHRPVAAGAAAGDSGPRSERVRPTRDGVWATRQPLAKQRPAQRVRDARRALDRDLRQRHVCRRTRDGRRRPARHRRARVVLLRPRAGAPRRSARPYRRRLGSPHATTTRSWLRSRTPVPRSRPSTTPSS